MFKHIVDKLRACALGFPDVRKGGNRQVYTVGDGCLSAFAVFFMQCPSFLAYQREVHERWGKDNAQSLFGLVQISSDNEIRELLDPVAPSHLGELYWEVFEELHSGGQLAEHRGCGGQWLCALDGVQFFSSNALACDECTRRQQGKKTLYIHSVIAPVLVAPGSPYVISLEPEFITPQDGAEKQDCEQTAARRWIERNAQRAYTGFDVVGEISRRA